MSPLLFRSKRLGWIPRGRSQEVRALAAQRQAVRTLVHDLRNPLNGILLMAQYLEETKGTTDLARLAGRIVRQCNEMNRLLTEAAEHLCD
jgi:signal transduction histidine kinase